ncbi:hypothetical protein ATE80_18705 [Streptomyces kanasensis]|uniref:SWIM-type domain-containing protein n=1 Tax=Streptomyces kanasensis TaxID=936756 RepID=A0A117IVL2_9ACTN|nr:hypothetical protein ATE80_18705 [Streptomyces kanasensis]
MELLLGGRRKPAGTCDCPHGQEGNFCKHLVALGLMVIACTPDDYSAYVADLRAAQKRKRNLMRLMDQHGL